MLFKAIKNSLLSTLLLIGGTIVFLFVAYWLFLGSFFREIIKETLSLSYIADNIVSLVIIFFIVLAYIIFRGTLELGEKKEIEKLKGQSQVDSQDLQSLKKEWLFKKIVLFVVFLIIMIIALAFVFVFMPLYKIGMENNI